MDLYFKFLLWIYKKNFIFANILYRQMEKCPGKKGLIQTTVVPYVRQWLELREEAQKNDRSN